MTRADLLALDTDALVALANRGLVKRAARELDAGAVPALSTDADGTVRGRFPDGVEVAFPVGAGLDTASCTCPATGVCRHRVGLVLAYQRETEPAERGPASEWSPGDIDDETLRQVLGARTLTAARRRRAAGYSAYVHRDAPAPWVELATCTVRFLVPGELGYAHTDAVGPERAEAIALAVWAFREADEHAPGEREVRLDVVEREKTPAEPNGGAASRQNGARGPESGAGPGEDAAAASGGGTGASGGGAASRESGAAGPGAADEGRNGAPGLDGGVEAGPLGAAASRGGSGPGDEADLQEGGAGASDGIGPRESGAAGTGGRGGAVGDRAGGRKGGPARPGVEVPAGMESAAGLATELLGEGAMHAGPVLGAALRRMCRAVGEQGLHWPAGALEDLVEQLDAYAARGARYSAEHYAELLTELHARRRAAAAGGLRSQILGGGEPGRTPLRRVRLVSLGCRVGGTVDERVAEVFFAHAGDGTVLVLRRRWDVPPDTRPTGHDLAGRRVAGTSLGALAVANLVSESASRSASRVVHIAPGRVAKTTVTPVGDAWSRLPAPVMVRDLAAASRALEELPPRLIRPRVAAEHVRVVEVAEVREVGYHPGAQRLDAEIADAEGGTARLTAEYRAHCPGALDALAAALADGPRVITGFLRRGRGALLIDPIAVLTAGGVTVPDLAPGEGDGDLAVHVPTARDRLDTALEAALTAFAEIAHRGLRHATPGVHRRIEEAAAELRRVGLTATADAATAFLAASRIGEADAMTRTWVDAQLRLITAADLR
ncbi:hypothetical protein [Actinoallomurus iriomotensis]|uniref:SWIM-type domain-containing protein n=1 Tax=Actinoallomurus iriomotensis TaxID=478107 RepID=A0A9W6W581_9ACTN|nr:hypothetical protein [Actinoallomurus iriomotensis]GLY91790.1 hypothetical protein Airi02_097180 [Actinoallomurus iriomotensis]